MDQKMNSVPDDDIKPIIQELGKMENLEVIALLQVLTLIRNTGDIITLTVETAGQRLKVSMVTQDIIQNFDTFLEESIKTLQDDLHN
jgi:hypothetical protein